MSDEQNNETEPDEAGGLLVLMSVGAMLLQGGQRTRDKRVLKLAGEVIDILKASNALEMMLIAEAQKQSMSDPTTLLPSQIVAQQRANQQPQTNWTDLLKAIGVGK